MRGPVRRVAVAAALRGAGDALVLSVRAVRVLALRRARHGARRRRRGRGRGARWRRGRAAVVAGVRGRAGVRRGCAEAVDDVLYHTLAAEEDLRVRVRMRPGQHACHTCVALSLPRDTTVALEQSSNQSAVLGFRDDSRTDKARLKRGASSSGVTMPLRTLTVPAPVRHVSVVSPARWQTTDC